METVTVVFTNLDSFWRSLFPVFIGQFEGFYIFLDILAIYGAIYCFIWFIFIITGARQ